MKPLAPKTCALPKNLPSLTSCRFFAALAVVLHHSGATGSAYEAVGKAGWMGVSFFFALSGFVLMWSFDILLLSCRSVPVADVPAINYA